MKKPEKIYKETQEHRHAADTTNLQYFVNCISKQFQGVDWEDLKLEFDSGYESCEVIATFEKTIEMSDTEYEKCLKEYEDSLQKSLELEDKRNKAVVTKLRKEIKESQKKLDNLLKKINEKNKT